MNGKRAMFNGIEELNARMIELHHFGDIDVGVTCHGKDVRDAQ